MRRGRARPLLGLFRALATPLGRGRLRASLARARIYQPATVTRADRHPALFAAVAARFADQTAPRLLSFGCSTGEEAFSLARAVPGATVDGIDVNPACVARARRTARALAEGARVRFARADAPEAFAAEPYDAVLCLSVLRHGELDRLMPDRSTARMPFTCFAEAVTALDRCVRPGGILVLWGSHFRFEDTTVAARYYPLPVAGVRPQPGPFYGPDDRRLPDGVRVASLFVKLR